MPTKEPVEGLSKVAAGNVRALRARARLRQKQVAEQAGLAPSVMSLIEGERRRISLDDALALCRGLGIDLAELLAGAEQEDLQTFGLHPQRGQRPSPR